MSEVTERVDAKAISIVYPDVLGWRVELRSNPKSPIDGPESLTISLDHDYDSVVGAVETDGITSAVLRAVPLADARRRLKRIKTEVVPVDVPSIQARTDTPAELAAFANTYAKYAGNRRMPLALLAAISGISRNTLSARVRRARDMGLLTRPPNVELTAKGRRLLRQGSATHGSKTK
jgi:hypothetical protein